MFLDLDFAVENSFCDAMLNYKAKALNARLDILQNYFRTRLQNLTTILSLKSTCMTYFSHLNLYFVVVPGYVSHDILRQFLDVSG